MSSSNERNQPAEELRIRRVNNFSEFSAQSGGEAPRPTVSTVTRYVPGFVLQVQIDSPSLADLFRAFEAQREKTESKPTVNAGAGLPSDAPRPPDRALVPAKPGASYRAGDVVVCARPDGGVPARPQIAAFLADVQDIRPDATVIGRVENLAALHRLADAVAQQPISGELLTGPFTTTLVV